MDKLIRRIPEKGTCEDILSRLYEYINQVDSEWIKKIRPTSREKINKLITLSEISSTGFNFPREYIKFLEVMGEDDGELLSSWLRADTNIDRILEVYEWIEEDRKNGIEDEDFKERKFIIAYDDISEERYIKIFEDGSHKIISGFEEVYGHEYLYEDFEKMLFYSALKKYEKIYFEYKAKFSYKDKYGVYEILSLIEEFLIKKEFKKAWFSDKNHLIVAKRDITIYVNKEMILKVVVLGSNKDQVEIISSGLNDFIKTRI